MNEEKTTGSLTPSVKGSDPHRSELDDAGPTQSAFKSYLRVFTYAGPWEKVFLALSIASSLASGVGLALVNLVFGSLVTQLSDFTSGASAPAEFRSAVGKTALYFVYIGIARLILTYIYAALFTIAAHRMVNGLRTHYLRSALCQGIAFYDQGTAGSIASQATSNGNLIQTGAGEKLGTVFQNLSAFISAFALAFATQWKLTLITSCFVPVMLVAISICSSMDAVVETKMLGCFAGASSFAEGILSTIRTIHAFELRSRLMTRYQEYLSNGRALGGKKNTIYGFYFSVEYCLIYCGFSLSFWRGTHMLASGEVTEVGDIFIVLFSVVIGAVSITNLAPHVVAFTRAAAAAMELFKLVDRPSDIDPMSTAGETPSSVEGVVEFHNVNFNYPTRPDTKVLEGFSLRVPAGKVTALVGASGSGKSTIIGLTERWYKPTSGDITIDGRSVAELNLGWLRTTVRLVQQEPVLFNGTVRDNIFNGLIGTSWEDETEDQKMQRAVNAAKLAFAHDFISELPEGYHTNIGQRGGLLSGGQKQRIAIARSVISQPTILLLDEATSALDPHAEGVVQKALDNVSQSRTTITIAHKMSTVRDADNIVVMSKGRIIEQGPHDALMERDEAYARLVKVQDLALAQSKQSSSALAEENSEELREALHLTTTATRSSMGRAEALKLMERDDYAHSKAKGLLAILPRFVRQTPALKWWYVGLIATSIGGGAAFPAQAIIFAELVEAFQLTGSALTSRGDFLALMFFVVAIAVFFIYFSMGWSTNVVSQQINYQYRHQLLDRFLMQDLQFFDRPENTVGALVSRLDAYPQSLLELMGMNLGLILISVVNVVACSVLSLAFSWKLGLVVVFAGLPPLMGSGWLKIRMEAKMEASAKKQYDASASVASEAVTAIRTVSSLTMEGSVLENYTRELQIALKKTSRSVLLMMPWFSMTQSIEYFVLALGFWYGCRLVSFEDITLFEFFVSFIGVFFAGQAAAQMFSFSSSITKAQGAANYILWLQSLDPLIAETESNKDVGPPNGAEHIEFKDAQFSYPLRPETRVMKGASLEIRKGQFVALVGASGCGKSTMIALLERFYDPKAGVIRVDARPLIEISPLKYRRQVSLVQQEPTLYQGSVRTNIAFGSPDLDVSDATIEAALRAANAWEFVSSLPDGLATECGAGGSQFSGGQKQRLAIARALVRDPKVLLLDEATSALDTESEKIVQAALAQASKSSERITIAVAHRLSTVKDADAICVFHGGRIVESGTHAELLATGKLYPAMCLSQNVA